MVKIEINNISGLPSEPKKTFGIILAWIFEWLVNLPNENVCFVWLNLIYDNNNYNYSV